MLLTFLALHSIPLADLNLQRVMQDWGAAQKNKSVDGHTLKIGDAVYELGVGTHAKSTFNINVYRDATNFHAMVGLDDETKPSIGSVGFHVLCDGKEKWSSGLMKTGDRAKPVDVDLRGVKVLSLVVDSGGDGINYDHADWADSRIEYREKVPSAVIIPREQPYILTPKPPKTPRLVGAHIMGSTPNKPFVWRIPATGSRPMLFAVKNLPKGLFLDPALGVISGNSGANGTHSLKVTSKNKFGSATSDYKLVVGDKIALTPPMGWNSWNCFATDVSDSKVRSAAEAFVAAGLADHGWQYVNIDDCWSRIPGNTSTQLGGALRNDNGEIQLNAKFPDMRALTNFIHEKGLRTGIYSSPGPTTCGGYASSFGHELDDAKAWAKWGFDYLKYDWCSYSEILQPDSLLNLKKPYEVMRSALNSVDRDIVFSMCQYGMGDVWKWGGSVGGNCWRTTGDITDTWESMSEIGFNQAGYEAFAKPGNWNDPDMLVVGWVGWGPALHPTKLTPSEQYTHITLWSLLCSPLLIGCDLTKLDAFTLNLLTNDEVIAVSQDALGKQATRIYQKDGIEIWSKNMSDGSTVFGVFNRTDMPNSINLDLKKLGISGNSTRDLWRQKSFGNRTKWTQKLRTHGCELFRVW